MYQTENSGNAGNGFEWPTWLVIITIYGTWFALIEHYKSLPAWLVNPALVLIAAWHMSLQHELLHGHPTHIKALNRLLGLFPMSAWYPYDIYRDSHLIHHRDEFLTTPGADPECNYVHPEAYAQMNGLHRAVRWSMRTVLGRLLIGPGLTIPAVWSDIFKGHRQHGLASVRSWALHIALLAAMLWWVQSRSGIGPLHYLFGIAYPALGLAMLRSFYEHRPAALPVQRIVINHASWPWRLLYLNNNYHLVHHEQPGLPWYRIPDAYNRDRAGFLFRNDDFQTPGYGYLLWNYAFKPVDSPIHPGFGPKTPK